MACPACLLALAGLGRGSPVRPCGLCEARERTPQPGGPLLSSPRWRVGGLSGLGALDEFAAMARVIAAPERVTLERLQVEAYALEQSLKDEVGSPVTFLGVGGTRWVNNYLLPWRERLLEWTRGVGDAARKHGRYPLAAIQDEGVREAWRGLTRAADALNAAAMRAENEPTDAAYQLLYGVLTLDLAMVWAAFDVLPTAIENAAGDVGDAAKELAETDPCNALAVAAARWAGAETPTWGDVASCWWERTPWWAKAGAAALAALAARQAYRAVR